MTTGRGDDTGLDLVTGAFSYSGSAISRRLLEAGRTVRTLTGHPERGQDLPEIEALPLDFGDPPGLTASLAGVTTLFNTYWVRFAYDGIDHDLAVRNSRTLFDAARQAGVAKIVHVSILNPSVASPYPYFRGKALVEKALAESGLPYAILRPSVLFDERGVLLNNIAWLLRRLPVFGVGGSGKYRVRPTHVDDLARLALDAASWPDDRIVDAVGPDRPTFLELVHQIGEAVGSRARIVRVPRRRCSASRRCSAPFCTTCSSRRPSTTPWRRVSPIRLRRRRARSHSRPSSPSTATSSAPATRTSSTSTSADGFQFAALPSDHCYGWHRRMDEHDSLSARPS